MAIRIPVKADLDTQNAFRDIEDRLRALENVPVAQPVATGVTVQQVNKEIQKALNNIPEVAGGSDLESLNGDGVWSLPLGGALDILKSEDGIPAPLPQPVIQAHGDLHVDSGLSAGTVEAGNIFVIDSSERLKIKYADSGSIGLHIVAPGGTDVTASPNEIANLTGWWKADAGVYSDAGSTLATDTQTCQQWNDQSGNGRHFSQSSSSNRPQFRTNIKNGLPVLKFFGQGDARYMTGGTIAQNLVSASAHTVFGVWYINAVSTYGGGLFSILDGGSTFWCMQNGLSTTDIYVVANDGSYRTINTAVTTGAWLTHCSLHSGGVLYRGILDARDSGLTSIACGNLAGLTGSYGWVGASSGAYLDGYIAEIITYNRALTEVERMGVEGYLAAKYNITIGYTPTSFSNNDLVLIKDVVGNEAFRLTSTGKLYVRGVLVY